jgi:hypothetical protein
MNMKELFVCECHDNHHMVVVSIYDCQKHPPEFSISVTADCHLVWYRRVWAAVKYAFGQPSLSWHDVLLSEADVTRLQNCISHYGKIKTALDQHQNPVP